MRSQIGLLLSLLQFGCKSGPSPESLGDTQAVSAPTPVGEAPQTDANASDVVVTGGGVVLRQSRASAKSDSAKPRDLSESFAADGVTVLGSAGPISLEKVVNEISIVTNDDIVVPEGQRFSLVLEGITATTPRTYQVSIALDGGKARSKGEAAAFELVATLPVLGVIEATGGPNRGVGQTIDVTEFVKSRVVAGRWASPLSVKFAALPALEGEESLGGFDCAVRRVSLAMSK